MTGGSYRRGSTATGRRRDHVPVACPIDRQAEVNIGHLRLVAKRACPRLTSCRGYVEDTIKAIPKLTVDGNEYRSEVQRTRQPMQASCTRWCPLTCLFGRT